jgi:hypothetical protein
MELGNNHSAMLSLVTSASVVEVRLLQFTLDPFHKETLLAVCGTRKRRSIPFLLKYPKD